MGSEDYEVYKILKRERQEDGTKRRETNLRLFAAARQKAAQAGMIFVQHTDVHYSLKSPAGWRLHVYPGNRRLYHDPQQPVKPPFLHMKPDWTLVDVVDAAIAASSSTEWFEEEINNQTKSVTNEQIETRAYFLWEAAGRPEGSGDKFWQEAEKELRGE